MMKKFFAIGLIVSTTAIMAGCSDTRRKPGAVYMPDMSYSKALETYAKPDSSRFTASASEIGEGKVFYTTYPVAGTIARGDALPFPYELDKPGDSTNYVASKQVQNPLPGLTTIQMKEAERLYLVNCGICHGTKLDGNGPLYNNGQGPFPSAPRALASDPLMISMPDGQMFYSITYGKNMMGSYASQVTTRQRWMIIHYIRAQQAGQKSTTSATDSTAVKAPQDSTAKAK
jgi:mono/diheme cytochrome c family protein